MSDAEKEDNGRPDEEESVPTERIPDPEGRPGSQIGPYKLLSTLGEGGFGIVYLAERQKPVRRRVALKVIKPGMDSKEVIARFEAERQALALLDHPNIAQVFDAGTTQAGRPYFVMEFVKGVSVTDHCDRQKLSIDERLDLFLQVCDGVQYAHQKGIIHRDIKPSNILVAIEADKAVPKMIDFGVAKAILQPLTERTAYTEQGQLMGTPEYMSPEQAEMTVQDIDTRSDIYSLGVMLYELMSGVLPFEAKTLREGGLDHIRHVIREEEPRTPSTRLSSLGDEEAARLAQRRRVDVGTLRRRLRGDLDWVTLKAMEKDRTRRYASAAELAADIRHHLNHEPVLASPPSTVYRMKKFVRRNRALVTGIAAVLVVLVAGIVTSTIFAIGQSRAREKEASARAEAQAVADFLHDVLASVEPARAKGPEVPVTYFLNEASKKLEREFVREPLAELAEASIRRTLGNAYVSLGKYEAAEGLLKRALEICQKELGEEHRSTLESMGDLGWLYWLSGVAGRRALWDDAEPLLVKTLEGRRRLLGEWHLDTAASMLKMGAMHQFRGHYDDAEKLFVEALEVRGRRLGPEHPDTLTSKFWLADLYIALGRYDDAKKLFEEVLDVQRRVLGVDHLDTLDTMMSLAGVYRHEGHVYDAEQLLVTALEGRKSILGQYHWLTLGSMIYLAQLYRSQGRYDEAEPLYVKALALTRRVFSKERPEMLGHMRRFALLYCKQEKYAEAEPLFVEALEEGLRELGEDHPQTILSMSELAWFRATCPDEKFRDGGEAVKLATRCCELTDWKNGWYISTLAAAYAEAGDFDAAVKWQKKAIGLLPENTSAEDRALIESWLQLYQSGQPYRYDVSVGGP